MFNLAKECGNYNDVVELYYLILRKTLKSGLKQLKGDTVVIEMAIIDAREGVVHLYVIYSVTDYNEALEQIKFLSRLACDAFLAQHPSKFYRSLVSTHTKSDVVVSNMVETFNGFIISARTQHIIPMLEQIRRMMMQRIYNQRNKGLSWDTELCRNVIKRIEIEKEMSCNCNVILVRDTTRFEVSHINKALYSISEMDEHIVDIVDCTFSCRKWTITSILCCHACAVVIFLRIPPKSFVHPMFKEEFMRSYSVGIQPLMGERHWPVVYFSLLPPPIEKMLGRPKKNMKKNPHEDAKQPGKLSKHGQVLTCSVCRATTHTKRNYPNKDNAPPPPPKRPCGRLVTRMLIPHNLGYKLPASDQPTTTNA